MEIPSPIHDSEHQTVYLLDDILDMKTIRRKRLFLIKWTGYEDPSWEPEELLRESSDFIPHLEQYLQEIDCGIRNKMKHMQSRRNTKAKPK